MKKYFIPTLILFVTLVGLTTALQLSSRQQEVRKQAAVSGGAGKITISPSATTKYPGQVFPVSINFNTGSSADAVSSISLLITYPYSGTTPELDIVDASGNQVNQITPNPSLTGSGDWAFPFKNVTRANGRVTIELAAINQNIAGYKSSTDVALASFYLKANRAPSSSPITVTFDTTQSKMMTKTDPPRDILDYPPSASYTIQNDTVSPNAITNLATSSPTKQSFILSWASPSDTGPEGKATSYDLRYSTATITESNWAAATVATGLPTPANSGTSQNVTLSGLSAGTTYYFAIKSTDASGNTSAFSNIASGNTLPATITFGFKLQGVGAVSGKQKTFDVIFQGGISRTFSAITFQSDANGVFTPSSPVVLSGISIPSAGISSTDVYVKSTSHLRKKLGSITMMPIDNIGPDAWKSVIVKAGDFNNNNTIKIDDIGLILSSYTSLNVAVNTSNGLYDVNLDGLINIDDVAVVLANYTQLEGMAGD